MIARRPVPQVSGCHRRCCICGCWGMMDECAQIREHLVWLRNVGWYGTPDCGLAALRWLATGACCRNARQAWPLRQKSHHTRTPAGSLLHVQRWQSTPPRSPSRVRTLLLPPVYARRLGGRPVLQRRMRPENHAPHHRVRHPVAASIAVEMFELPFRLSCMLLRHRKVWLLGALRPPTKRLA